MKNKETYFFTSMYRRCTTKIMLYSRPIYFIFALNYDYFLVRCFINKKKKKHFNLQLFRIN